MRNSVDETRSIKSHLPRMDSLLILSALFAIISHIKCVIYTMPGSKWINNNIHAFSLICCIINCSYVDRIHKFIYSEWSMPNGQMNSPFSVNRLKPTVNATLTWISNSSSTNRTLCFMLITFIYSVSIWSSLPPTSIWRFYPWR